LVSLKDISVRCGVSVATVSKALNGHKDVSEATRERLVRTAKEMGYFPNSQARALKTNRTYNLGVMFLDEAGRGLTHEFFAKVLNSFKTEAERSGYDITFISNKDIGGRRMSTYEHCKYRSVDGIVIACTDFTTPDVFEVINGDIPVVTIDHIFDCRTAVVSNNEGGMEELVRYVADRGHTKIAYIQGKRSAVSEKRFAGFYKGCKAKGIELRPDWLLTGDYCNPDNTYQLTKMLLKGREIPTCIFMPDDYAALGGLNAIKDKGVSVPDDISVVGYDGIAYSQLLSPRLTTYSQDTPKIGATAANRLISLIEDPQTTFNEVVTVNGRFLEGGSVKQL